MSTNNVEFHPDHAEAPVELQILELWFVVVIKCGDGDEVLVEVRVAFLSEEFRAG